MSSPWMREQEANFERLMNSARRLATESHVPTGFLYQCHYTEDPRQEQPIPREDCYLYTVGYVDGELRYSNIPYRTYTDALPATFPSQGGTRSRALTNTEHPGLSTSRDVHGHTGSAPHATASRPSPSLKLADQQIQSQTGSHQIQSQTGSHQSQFQTGSHHTGTTAVRIINQAAFDNGERLTELPIVSDTWQRYEYQTRSWPFSAHWPLVSRLTRLNDAKGNYMQPLVNPSAGSSTWTNVLR